MKKPSMQAYQQAKEKKASTKTFNQRIRKEEDQKNRKPLDHNYSTSAKHRK